MEKKVRIIRTYVRPSLNDDEFLMMIREYDKNGNQIFTKEYDEENQVIFENKLNFENEKLISEESISYTDNYGEKKSYTYDESGKLIAEKIEYDGGWYSIKKYERDSGNRILTISSYDEENQLEEMSQTEYDEKGNIVSYREYDEENNLKQMVKNNYREDGLLVLKEEYEDSKKPIKTHHYYYNDEGKITAVQTLNSSGRSLDWVKINYNEKGRPQEQLTMSGLKVVLEYSENEKTITETQISSSGEIVNITKVIKDENGEISEEHSVDKMKRYVYEYF
jgi:hypothetical protein